MTTPAANGLTMALRAYENMLELMDTPLSKEHVVSHMEYNILRLEQLIAAEEQHPGGPPSLTLVK